MEFCNIITTSIGKMLLCSNTNRDCLTIMKGIKLQLEYIRGTPCLWDLPELCQVGTEFDKILKGEDSEQEIFQVLQNIQISITPVICVEISEISSVLSLYRIQALCLSSLINFYSCCLEGESSIDGVFNVVEKFKKISFEQPQSELLRKSEIFSGQYDLVNEILFLLAVMILRYSSVPDDQICSVKFNYQSPTVEIHENTITSAASYCIEEFMKTCSLLKQLFSPVMPELKKIRSNCQSISLSPLTHRTDVVAAAVLIVSRDVDPLFCLNSTLYCS